MHLILQENMRSWSISLNLKINLYRIFYINLISTYFGSNL